MRLNVLTRNVLTRSMLASTGGAQFCNSSSSWKIRDNCAILRRFTSSPSSLSGKATCTHQTHNIGILKPLHSLSAFRVTYLGHIDELGNDISPVLRHCPAEHHTLDPLGLQVVEHKRHLTGSLQVDLLLRNVVVPDGNLPDGMTDSGTVLRHGAISVTLMSTI
uniref:Uncharacterized protein n=1 Tax=Timema monikensis TaxID=170555 RepID=A0A7R9HNG6_9NEOP|nr:unnamed protein product [Timema monikensis]